MRRFRAFTLIEVLVATAIIALVATSAAVDLTRSRMTGRDGRRKQDLQAFNQAITAYQLATGNSFIQYPGTSTGCALPASPSDADPSSPSSGAGCTGANGRAYGMVNLSGATTQATTGGDAGRTYPAKSIADALVAAKYLSAAGRDPLAVGSLSDPKQPDYVLVRCCKDGRQSIGSNSQNFAIWAHLEGTPTQTESDNSANLCGGSVTAAGVVSKYPGVFSSYHYDNANGGSDSADLLNYGVGTSVTPSVSEAASSCFKG